MRAFDLARRQVAIDRRLTERFPELFDRKLARMLASPHGFLRGSAPLFYEILAEDGDLEHGPAGSGWIVGDMHIENLGAYKSDEQRVVFGLNDFDDAAIAPRRFDVLRLTTSVILSGRSFAQNASRCVELAEAVVEAYVNAAFDGDRETPALTLGMVQIVERASRRAKKDLLEARAPLVRGRRHFVRGERYLDLPRDLADLPKEALAIYVAALGNRAPKAAKSWEIEDAAQRIAGTGSLGRIRIAVLVRDDSGEERIFDFKEAAPASSSGRIDDRLDDRVDARGRDAVARAGEVVAAPAALLESVPRLLAPIALPARGMSMIGRQLAPQEDKLDLSRISTAVDELEGITARVGHILGAAHRRAGHTENTPATPWSEPERAALVDRALELAGLYESVYLAYARVTEAIDHAF